MAPRSGFRRMFSVSALEPPKALAPPPKADPSPNLFISGLSKRTSTEGLRDFAAKFGEVVQARAVTDRVTGFTKGGRQSIMLRSLAARRLPPVPRRHLHDHPSGIIGEGFRHYAELSSPCRTIAEVDKAMRDLERSLEVNAPNAKRARSIGKKGGEAMMLPLHFHYEDVLRQDLLLKLNHTNIMEIPGLFEIRLVPKTASDFKPQIGKLAMEVLCGQRFIQEQAGPAGRKSSRSNPFYGGEKDAASGFARQSVLRGHAMYNFLVRMTTVMSMLDSKVQVKENTIKFFMETEFCEFSPELEDHFEIFEHMRGFNVTVITSASTKEVASLLWSGFMLRDEGETS